MSGPGAGALLAALVLVLGTPSKGSGWRAVTQEGRPVTWSSAEVVMMLGRDHPQHWGAAALESAVSQAMDAWSSVDCSEPHAGLYPSSASGASLQHPPTLDFRWSDRAHPGDHGDGVNAVGWVHEGWPHGASALALTVLTVNEDGSLAEADVAVNVGSVGFRLTDECVDGGFTLGHDLTAVLTHEFGHVLGLDHSTDRTATMFDVSHQGSCALRTLASDDIVGLCQMYLHGAAAGPPQEGEDPGCASTPGGPGGSLPFALFAWALWRGWQRLRWLALFPPVAAGLVRSLERDQLTR